MRLLWNAEKTEWRGKSENRGTLALALSDLAVSGGLPSDGKIARHRFPPSPYGVYP
jgi:hypothetical protein